jgi:hypothetical protein
MTDATPFTGQRWPSLSSPTRRKRPLAEKAEAEVQESQEGMEEP